MARIIPLLFTPLLFLISCSAPSDEPEDQSDDSLSGEEQTSSPEWEIREDFGKYFREAGVEGGIVILDRATNRFLVYDSLRCVTRFAPASTFKIFNALAGLETGVLEDENEVIPWDSVKRSWNEWNRDHTLRSGMKYSTVWFYQELARRIGRERMQSYLDSVGYGNRTIGDDVDKFWLDGSLRISPVEQVEFLRRLADDTLPFSKRSMDIVRDIITLERTDTYTYRGKTGWVLRDSVNVGWFVGYLQRGEDIYLFATNVNMRGDEDIKSRQGITRRVLHSFGLIEE